MGEIISQGLEDTLQSWDLREDQQVCITTDNGANIVKAVHSKAGLDCSVLVIGYALLLLSS